MSGKRNATFHLVDDIMAAKADPGAAKWWQSPDGATRGFHFICPCGCGGVGGVQVKPAGWTWDGNRDAPTVSPSVYFNRGEPGEWHGYLRVGVFEEC